MKEKYKETTEIKILEICDKDLREWLYESGYIGKDDKCEFYFCIPSGGDWSGMSLEVDEKYPIKVRIVSQK